MQATVSSSPSTCTHPTINDILRGAGPLRSLDPHIGEPTPGPLQLFTLAVAPSSNPMIAFQDAGTVQSLLCLSGQAAGKCLPPLVTGQGAGRWAYLYFPTSTKTSLFCTLSLARFPFPSLATSNLPLSDHAKTLLKPHSL